MSFSKNDSQVIKGIAITMMLWHHCFLTGRYEDFSVFFYPFSESQIVHIATFFKICVSLFAFVSGYGMYLSFQKWKGTINYWLKIRLIRLLQGYWFIVLLSWIVCLVIDKRPIQVYFKNGSNLIGFWNMAMEFLGLSNLMGAEKLNMDWWYISAAIVFVVLTPLLYKALTSLGSGCVIAVCFIVPRLFGYLGGTHWLSFLLAFIFGMVFAKEELFLYWNNLVAGGGISQLGEVYNIICFMLHRLQTLLSLTNSTVLGY